MKFIIAREGSEAEIILRQKLPLIADGQILGVSASAFESFRNDMIQIELPQSLFELRAYLREDASFLQCSKCRRKSWGGEPVNGICGMTQPDGGKCDGVLEGKKED